ncbi:hypothetical protein NSND_60418 [Nitrospira sp. ND1]|nr:hypothetical protein NSND_60418 [Nitrospira sp. ND1]
MSTLIPSSREREISSRTDLMPSWCPAIRGRPRSSAQRPLPSIITARCFGSRSGSSCESRSESGAGSISRDRESFMERREHLFLDYVDPRGSKASLAVGSRKVKQYFPISLYLQMVRACLHCASGKECVILTHRTRGAHACPMTSPAHWRVSG